MAYKEKKTEKLYFTIGEVADKFAVNASLIRFWEKEFDTIRPRKNTKGNRLFTQKDIESIKLIYHLVKEKGMTLSGAKKKIKENKNDSINHEEIVLKLQEIRNQLNEITHLM